MCIRDSKEIGCSIRGLDFNAHGKHHIIRAAQEGIVFLSLIHILFRYRNCSTYCHRLDTSSAINEDNECSLDIICIMGKLFSLSLIHI